MVDVIDWLLTPVNLGDNPEEVEANLTMERQILLQEATELAVTRKQLGITRRDYDHVHGFTPATVELSQRGQVWRRGGELGGRMEKDGEPDPTPALIQPTYSTPIENLRATRAAAKELPNLEGEERARQHARVQELLRITDEQADANRLMQEDPSYSREQATCQQ